MVCAFDGDGRVPEASIRVTLMNHIIPEETLKTIQEIFGSRFVRHITDATGGAEPGPKKPSLRCSHRVQKRWSR